MHKISVTQFGTECVNSADRCLQESNRKKLHALLIQDRCSPPDVSSLQLCPGPGMEWIVQSLAAAAI